MPKKGRRNKQETIKEHHPNFIRLRNAHSAVESNINQLEHNGLGRCIDKGIENFTRYAALSILANNLHKLAEHIEKKEVLKLKKQHKSKIIFNNSRKVRQINKKTYLFTYLLSNNFYSSIF